ncbi:MAG: hypothetical protein IT289_08855 [Oligoflexia bacterium]|nr:hypothetical protein [Oligoflexia bacterium]
MNNAYREYFKKKAELAKKKNRPKGARIKIWLTGTMLIATAGGAGYLFSTPMGTRLLDRVEVSFLGEAVAEQKAKKEEAKPQAKETSEGKKDPTEVGPVAGQHDGANKAWTDEELALFTKLEARKAQLDNREAELQKVEAELQNQKAELEKRLAELDELRAKIANRLDDKVKIDEQKVETLVSVYSNMKPSQAAKVLETANEDLVIAVLGRMKNKNAAEILNLMDAEKAKKLSEKFAGFREPASKK